MKKNKKLIVNLAAVILATTSAGSIITTNQAHAAQTTDQTQNKTVADGTLTLNHNTRIYNKKGQKLYSYQRTNGLLKKGTRISYAKKVKAIDDPSTVRYSFHDDNWNWFYLPYKTIKGQEYYSIGHGGYVKAVNVDKIIGNNLYTNQTVATVEHVTPNSKDGLDVFDDHRNNTGKKIKIGKTVIVNREAAPSALDMNYYEIDGNTPSAFYGIKDQNEYIYTDKVKVATRQLLLPYSNYTTVMINKNTPVYDINGKQKSKNIVQGYKELPVDELLYIWVPGDNQAELFYRLSDKSKEGSFSDSTDFIKAKDNKYIYGPRLEVINSVNDAKNAAVSASNSDKQKLQTVLDKESSIKNSAPYKFGRYLERNTYLHAIDNGNKVIQESQPTQAEINQAIWSLQDAAKNLNGKKVVVKDINKLSKDEASQIESLAKADAAQVYNGTNSNTEVEFNKDKTKLTLTVYNNKTEKKTQQILNINDYAEEN
ncbi:SLAP domain-containing protein [Lactobacillus sp. ESL0679]|uniref:SLAP domain-containing protein n=1 Tax=Lactobacillus sp. ESL0679 TaxID=2983209 RepID=UPI0023F6E2FD|nr:SLAP domain-containing protein [Lactobacillus sp. ESL0679]MDF7682148.1 SLAP domain-containing protein [Lactobacillus sp. ESL0679]